MNTSDNILQSKLGTFLGRWREHHRNWVISSSSIGTACALALSLGFLAWRAAMLPPQVPLWYSRPWGTDQLSSPVWLLILPAATVLCYIINTLVATYVTVEYLVFSQILYISSLVVAILSVVSLVNILFLIS